MLDPNTLLHDRYLILSSLGHGGMGAVYQATDKKFGNTVAIKETFFNDLQLQQAFSQEAKLLNRLRHPALPVVMDYFAVGERQFLVMQYIEGKGLEQCLTEQKQTGQGVFLTSQVLRWADQLLDALEYLHSQEPPIIHRDIKPQNIKLTPRGEVVLLDFGLAKGVTSHHSKSSQSIRGYTPNYASLEQIRGTGTDARSDIYSIGATLYHLLTGVLPQDALTRIAAILLGQPDPLRPIAELNSKVTNAIASVIEKAVSPHPDQRFETAAMMRQALRNGSSNLPLISLHRTPTLTDDPMFSGIEAAASIPLEIKSGPELKPPVVDSHTPKEASTNSKEDSGPIDQPVAQPRRTRSLAKIYGLIALLLILGAAGFGIYRLQEWGGKLIDGINTLISTKPATAGGPSLAIPVRLEAMRYYLELAPGTGEQSRATGLMPLPSGSRFKFHFRPSENGYLYIIALGAGNNWQTFLTNQPVEESGVITNYVKAGDEFQFPDGGQWFMMQPDSETTPFTIIFSPEPLKTPAFLAIQSGHELNQTEMLELAVFRKKLPSRSLEMVAIADNNQPAVVVQVASDRTTSELLIFDITLKKATGD